MRLIIVDSDRKSSQSLATLIEQCGHTVEAAVDDVQSAFDLALRIRPDLVMADVDLSRAGGGIQAAVLIHDAIGIKTIFVASRFDPQTRDRAQHAWPLAFLTKPVDAKLLASVLAGAAALIADRHRSGAGPALPLAS